MGTVRWEGFWRGVGGVLLKARRGVVVVVAVVVAIVVRGVRWEEVLGGMWDVIAERRHGDGAGSRIGAMVLAGWLYDW